MRVGVIKDWSARWFAKKGDFAANIKEDNELRKQLKKQLYAAGISRIETERAANKLTVNNIQPNRASSSARAARALKF